MAATLVREANDYQLAAPSALNSGAILAFAGLAVVYTGTKPALNGELIRATGEGQFDLDSASATEFAVGDPVYINNTSGLAVTSATGDFLAGVCVKAKTSGQLKVLVALNEYVAPAGS